MFWNSRGEIATARVPWHLIESRPARKVVSLQSSPFHSSRKSLMTNRHRAKTRRRFFWWAFAIVMVPAIVAAGALATARWLGLPPYGGDTIGIIISKNMVTYQGRGTRLEYFVTVRTSSGSLERLAVPQEIFRAVVIGWKVSRRANVITATSPNAEHSVL